MKNYHAVMVKYLGATNTKGSRVKLTSDRFGQSVVINYDYNMSDIADMAVVWLADHGFDVIGHAETKNGYVIFSGTFKPLREGR
jgi:hypothetical protein